MITRFRVQNYKALRDVTLDLSPMHLLIGPNDSGKTSILEAIAALCRSVEHPLADSFIGPWNAESLVYNRATDREILLESNVQTDLSEHPIIYQLRVRFDPQLRVVKEFSEAFGHDGNQYTLNADNIHNATRLYEINVRRVPTLDDAARQIENELVQSLNGVQYYHWIPEHLSMPAALDSQRRLRMESTGFGLPTILDDIRDIDPDQFDQLEKRFCKIFPNIESVRPRTERGYQDVSGGERPLRFQPAEGKGLRFRFKGDSADVPAQQASDGVLLTLAYLAVFYLPNPPRILLIEEPENGIHPSRLREVLSILRDLVGEQDHTQVILTSHSPYVVSMFEPDEVTLCHKGDDGAVEVRRLSESKTVQEQVDFFTLGEIWTLEGDEALLEAAKESPAAP